MSTDNTQNNMRTLWEERAKEKKDSCNSVLFQGLPDFLNNHIHDCHWYIISKYLLPRIPKGSNVLDLGCGYGRIGKLIAEIRPDLKLFGVDFSFAYCEMCNKNTNMEVACANIMELPFKDNSFEAIIAITSLMYVPTEHRSETMKILFRLLKPGGKGLFIDPGQEFMSLVSFLKPSSRNQSTGGNGFTSNEYKLLGNFEESVILKYGGIPVFSIAIPFLYLLSWAESLNKLLLIIIKQMDRVFYKLERFSIHRWILIEKKT